MFVLAYLCSSDKLRPKIQLDFRLANGRFHGRTNGREDIFYYLRHRRGSLRSRLSATPLALERVNSETGSTTP